MDNQELRQLCERAIELDKTSTSKGRAWWSEGTQVHSSQAIICECRPLFNDEFDTNRAFNTITLIAEYRNSLPDIATHCIRLLAENEAMRDFLVNARNQAEHDGLPGLTIAINNMLSQLEDYSVVPPEAGE